MDRAFIWRPLESAMSEFGTFGGMPMDKENVRAWIA